MEPLMTGEASASRKTETAKASFVVPCYGKNTLAELLPSTVAALNPNAVLPVPCINYLKLPEARDAIVVLLDGLGSLQLQEYAGHATFLARAAEKSREAYGGLTSAFPSTTATSLASLSTGLPPAQHGIVGYEVLEPRTNTVMNHLSRWPKDVDPHQWQKKPTLFEQLSGSMAIAAASYPKFERTPTTRAMLRGPSFLGAQDFNARIDLALNFISVNSSKKRQCLVYLYSDQPDRAGHRHGVGSSRWTDRLEDLDAGVRYLVRKKSKDTLVVVTSDHGMITVDTEDRIDFSSEKALMDNVVLTAGEPRCVYLYAADSSDSAIAQMRQAWAEKYEGKAWVFSKAEATALGLFGGGGWGKKLAADAAARVGDIILAAKERWAFYDCARMGISLSGSKVIGQHGSVTAAETEVPLIVFD